MTFISLRSPALGALTTCPNSLNRVLHPTDDPEWPRVIAATGLDSAECWPRKIPAATFQYAHLMKATLMHFPQGVKGRYALFPGAYEDPVPETLRRMGAAECICIDPAYGPHSVTLRQYVEIPDPDPASWQVDLVLCASVLEHTVDDAEFLRDIVTCLRPGGYAFLTCDYKAGWKPGDPLAPTEERLYTEESLMRLTDTIAGDVEWCGEREWGDRGDYFPYGGIVYAFAGIAFRKRGGE